MKVGPYIGFIVLVMVFGSAILGMLIRRKLPESHLSDESQSVVRVSMGVVGTLTALVLGLLVATASTTFNTRNQEITQFAAKVIQLGRLLQRYGPEADGERDLLRLIRR
jgi:NADH:ubiquinone oxidoreductase subunit 6 (subunit J)